MPRMLVIRRILPALLLCLLLPTSASAGGIGFFNQTGFHFGEALSQAGGTGQWMDEGGGIEVLLGSQASRVKGRVRLSYSAIIDLQAPDAALGIQHSGVVSGGVHVELLPDFEEKIAGLYVLVDVGVSPLVSQQRTFVFFDVGAGVRITPVERFSIFVEATGWMRVEKTLSGGPLFFVGARIALD